MQTSDFKITALLQHFLSLNEANAVIYMLEDEDYSWKDILDYIDWSRTRYEQDLSTDIEEWLEDRKPRVKIEIFVTEYGHPVHEKLEFPKRGEDMDHGTEFEWYYSLREKTDAILALSVGESMNFKIRDDHKSHGTILRIA